MSAAIVESVNTETETKPVNYCFAFFGRGRNCTKENCTYSHDVEAYKTLKGLRDCPKGCGNWCLINSKQCSSCLKKSREERQSRPRYCFGHFGRSRICNREAGGEVCPYSHDEVGYKADNGLKDCPNECGNYCRLSSEQCSNCVRADRETRRLQRAEEFQNRPEQPCMTRDCGEMTRYRYCRGCYEAQQMYTINRNNGLEDD